jgi:hypothetical protein
LRTGCAWDAAALALAFGSPKPPGRSRWSPPLRRWAVLRLRSRGHFGGRFCRVEVGVRLRDGRIRRAKVRGRLGGRLCLRWRGSLDPTGGRGSIPAALRYPATVSRRTPVARRMRRSDQPSRPNAITCRFFSSLKTLLMPTERVGSRRCQCPGVFVSVAGFQVTISGRFWVAAEVPAAAS